MGCCGLNCCCSSETDIDRLSLVHPAPSVSHPLSDPPEYIIVSSGIPVSQGAFSVMVPIISQGSISSGSLFISTLKIFHFRFEVLVMHFLFL
jgi:hypothetical protein